MTETLLLFTGGLSSQCISAVKANEEILKFRGMETQEELSFRLRSFRLKLILQVLFFSLNRSVLNGIAISKVHASFSFATSEYQVLSQELLIPIPPPY